jgi:hypothetical protein
MVAGGSSVPGVNIDTVTAAAMAPHRIKAPLFVVQHHCDCVTMFDPSGQH